MASLMYALKLLMTWPGCRISSDNDDSFIDSNQLNADQLQALECVLLLVTHLVYSDIAFLSQFCDAVALLHLCPRLHGLLLLSKRKVRIVTDLVAILMRILEEMPENAGVVEEIVLTTVSPGWCCYLFNKQVNLQCYCSTCTYYNGKHSYLHSTMACTFVLVYKE